ncbi:MAG TPA: hypothetical protein VG651_05235 [Stellaceae bacterium]|nr:hypothetical protein [Stellaceae bacterium]
MSLTENRWFRRLGFAAVAVLGLTGSVMLTSPAQAHDVAHRPAVVHHTAFFPRIFFGLGHGHHAHHDNHWDHRWR